MQSGSGFSAGPAVYISLCVSLSVFLRILIPSADTLTHAALIPDFDQLGIAVPCGALPVDLQVFAVKFDLVCLVSGLCALAVDGSVFHIEIQGISVRIVLIIKTVGRSVVLA